MSFFLSQNTPKSMSAGLRPRSHWGSLQRFPRPPSWFQGDRFVAGVEMEGMTRRKGREGKGGMGEGGGNGELGE